MFRCVTIFAGLTIALGMVSVQGGGQSNSALLLQPDSPEMKRRAPEMAHVRLETARGIIRLEMRRAWAPRKWPAICLFAEP